MASWLFVLSVLCSAAYVDADDESTMLQANVAEHAYVNVTRSGACNYERDIYTKEYLEGVAKDDEQGNTAVGNRIGNVCSGNKACCPDFLRSWRPDPDTGIVTSGAGKRCCQAKENRGNGGRLTQMAELCGLCARYEAIRPQFAKVIAAAEKGPLFFRADGKPDESKFGEYMKCAEQYCKAREPQFFQDPALKSAMWKGIAEMCSPDALKLNNPSPEKGSKNIALVANNPKKCELWDFVESERETIRSKWEGHFSGTGSSAKMTEEVTGVPKSPFFTRSGPMGGDAELAGLMAQDKLFNTGYVEGVIFFNDEAEAHNWDIQALKNLVIDYFHPTRYALCPAGSSGSFPANPCAGSPPSKVINKIDWGKTPSFQQMNAQL